MDNGLVLVAALGVAATAVAPPLPPLANMDFEQGAVGATPPGWRGETIRTVADHPERGAKALLLTSAQGPKTFSRTIDAAPFRGKRVRFCAAVRVNDPAAVGAGLWLRIDGARKEMLFLDNMSDRPVRSKAWTFVEVVAHVPADAAEIAFGGLLFGPGEAAFDTASLAAEEEKPITPEARAYLDQVLNTLQREHLDSASVDWPRLRAAAWERPLLRRADHGPDHGEQPDAAARRRRSHRHNGQDC